MSKGSPYFELLLMKILYSIYKPSYCFFKMKVGLLYMKRQNLSMSKMSKKKKRTWELKLLFITCLISIHSLIPQTEANFENPIPFIKSEMANCGALLICDYNFFLKQKCGRSVCAGVSFKSNWRALVCWPDAAAQSSERLWMQKPFMNKEEITCSILLAHLPLDLQCSKAATWVSAYRACKIKAYVITEMRKSVHFHVALKASPGFSF